MYVDRIRNQIILFDNDTVEITIGYDFTTWMIGARRFKTIWFDDRDDFELYWEIRIGPARISLRYDKITKEES